VKAGPSGGVSAGKSARYELRPRGATEVTNAAAHMATATAPAGAPGSVTRGDDKPRLESKVAGHV